MSTRSSISLKKNNQFKSIYCHNDGYLDGVGRTLYNNYKTENDVEKLLKLGDLSSLGRLPISKPVLWDLLPFSPDYAKLADKYCRAYKDRGDTGVDGTINKSVKEILDKYDWSEYHYIFDADLGKWFYTTGSTKLKPLFKDENQIREGIDMKKFTITYEVKNDESTGRFRSIIVKAESEERAKEKLLAKRPNIEIIGVHTTEDVDVRKGMPELREAVDNKELLAHQQKVAVAKTTEEEQEPVFADATRNFEKTAKVKAEVVKLEKAPEHDEKPKRPKMVPGAKKMMLDESLFEDWDDEDDDDYDEEDELEPEYDVEDNGGGYIYIYDYNRDSAEFGIDFEQAVDIDSININNIINANYKEQFKILKDLADETFEVLSDYSSDFEQLDVDDIPDDIIRLWVDKVISYLKEYESDTMEEQLTETKAKPEGDKVAGYNKALEKAKQVNKPVIYGYYTANYGKKYFDTPELIVVEDESTIKDFENRHRGVKVTYVAYPDKSPITEEKEESLWDRVKKALN